MPIETSVTHIADLEPLYPLGTDNRLQGDNHIRNIKTALVNDLPLNAPSTAIGRSILTGADAADARTALGSTATGDALFTTATAATARTTLDVYSKSEVPNVPNQNIIDNSNFAINQRGVTGTVSLAAGAFGHDRWKAGASGCTYTFSTSANVTTLTISAGSLVQNIRGETLQTGTHVLSWSGTAQGKIGAGSYAASGVTGSATGGTNLAVEFGTGTLSLVQFVPGSTVFPFIHRHKSVEESLCQKSYVRLNYAATFDLWVTGYCVINEYLQSNLVLPIPMWGTPTVTTSAALTTTNVYQTFVKATSAQTFYVRCRATATGQATCYNTGAFYIDLTSEI